MNASNRCCLHTTTILQAVVTTAKLAALWGIDTAEPDADSMNFQRVAVNDAGLADEIIGQCAPAEGASTAPMFGA
jgi:hypothetical protein